MLDSGFGVAAAAERHPKRRFVTVLRFLTSSHRTSRDPLEMKFYKLLLQLLSYGTILAVQRQTCCEAAPTCQFSIMRLYGALGDTTYSRDETDTGCSKPSVRKKYPFERNATPLLLTWSMQDRLVSHGTQYC